MAATTMAMSGSAALGSLRVERATSSSSLSSSAAMGGVTFSRRQQRVALKSSRRVSVVKAAKELHFNKDGSAIKRMQVMAMRE